jgi:nucleoside-diphosphate-sugar epimerase
MSLIDREPADNQLELAGLKVLVTGGSGFIGVNLCRYLCKAGSQVYATSRTMQVNEPGGPTWWQGDVGDLATTRYLISSIKPDIIFHLSGMVGASPSLDLVLPTFHSLLASTVNILAVLAEGSCRRIVLAASLTEPQPSQDELTPGSPYAAAKWASGAYGRMFHHLYGTPCVIVRPFMAYGPGQDPKKLIPSVVLALMAGESPKLSSGQWQADWVYIDDVIEGFIQAALAPRVEGATIDLGSGALVSVRTVVEQIVSVMGGDKNVLFGALPDRPFEQVRQADTAGAFAKIGWKATTSLERGLQQTVDWYRGQEKAMLCAKVSGRPTIG